MLIHEEHQEHEGWEEEDTASGRRDEAMIQDQREQYQALENAVEHMSANQPLLLKDEVYNIVGAAIDVHRELGPGFSEAVYEEAFHYRADGTCDTLQIAGAPTHHLQEPHPASSIRYRCSVLRPDPC